MVNVVLSIVKTTVFRDVGAYLVREGKANHTIVKRFESVLRYPGQLTTFYICWVNKLSSGRKEGQSFSQGTLSCHHSCVL